MRICAPPDKQFAELLAGVGVPLVPVGPPTGSMVRPSAVAATLVRHTGPDALLRSMIADDPDRSC
ncbi:hypothetical protein NCC78_19950 [Micromonospora phytophila]|uniref:hypothetical protein n=1 Tax=Micromonospora phytophila TaxID=709888 RepID=UPI00202EF1E6|nr:hypothetical protein [Micromonospora phytophila]MCM0676944.1 hypothetical protein [Micromonospora phytophila]